MLITWLKENQFTFQLLGEESLGMTEVKVLGHIMQNTKHEIKIFALKFEIDCIKFIRCGLFIILQFIY